MRAWDICRGWRCRTGPWRATCFPKEASLSDDKAKQLEDMFWKVQTMKPNFVGSFWSTSISLGGTRSFRNWSTLSVSYYHVWCTGVERKDCRASASI